MSRFCLFKKIFLAIAVILCFGQINARENFSGRHKSSMPVTTADNKPQTKQETFNDYKVDILSGTKNDNLSIKDVVGKIPFTEGVTPSGGKTYTIPITMPPVKSSAPQIALTYNSQAGNGVAGYGWNIVGLSAITITGKSIHYDGFTDAPNLLSPSSNAFLLDGIRLVNYGNVKSTPPIIIPENPDEDIFEDYYNYETAQGFVLVKSHYFQNNTAYFTAAYPNGSIATFGYKNNTQPKHIYPITEITDINGYKINFTYIESGNNYYISKINYGGKTSDTHWGEIKFVYHDRADFVTAYMAGVPVSSNKLLKTITSKSKTNETWEELCTYKLTHELTDVNRLTRLDCLTGNSSLNPITFSYNYYEDNYSGILEKKDSINLHLYFQSVSNPIFKRGKFIKNGYTDGLITYPSLYPDNENGYPEDQKIIIVPIVSSLGTIGQTITMGEKFQTIEAVDVDGDGVDEIVKINLNGVSGIITIGNQQHATKTVLKITVYKVSSVTGSGYGVTLKYTFNVEVEGAYNHWKDSFINDPLPRTCIFGDFKGNGKAQLLAISPNIKPDGSNNVSQFALIDLEHKYKISENSLFSFGFEDNRFLLPLDINGDGKTELCFLTTSGTDVYELYKTNSFIKKFSSNVLSRGSLFMRGMTVGDLNGDGKPDLLVSPKASLYSTITKNLPVWYPRLCPYCYRVEPLSLDFGYPQHCKHCNKDLWEYYANNPEQAKCRECGTQLEYCQEKDKKNIKSEDKNFSYCCPEHGDMVLSQASIEIEDNGNTWNAYISKGDGFISRQMNITTNVHNDEYLLMDINGDGYADFIYAKNGILTPYLNINGTISSKPEVSLSVSAMPKILPANTVKHYSSSHFIAINNSIIERYEFTKNSTKSNLLTTLIDSYENKHINEYADMTEPISNYFSTETTFNYPFCSFIAPMNLIRQSEINTKTGENISHYSYFYHGAVIHRTGLGFCGFEKVKTLDAVENMEIEEFHAPLLFGVVTKVESTLKTGNYSYETDNFSNKKNNPRLIYVNEIDKLTGVSSEAWYEYNKYNSPTKITEIIGSGANAVSSITTQTYYGPQQSGYYNVSLPQEKTVTSTRNGNSWTTREFIEYDGYLPESRITYTGAGNSANNKTGETRWTYDSYGNVTSEKSAPYNVTTFRGTTYGYDLSGRFLTSVTNAFRQKTTYDRFDKFGNACSITDHKGRTTTKVFDAWGRQKSETTPDGVTATTNIQWGGLGCYTVTEKVTGKPDVIVHYDALDRKVRSGSSRFDGSWLFTDYEYDSRGRLYRTSLPFKGSAPSHWNTYQYDSYNRPISYSEASGKTTT